MRNFAWRLEWVDRLYMDLHRRRRRRRWRWWWRRPGPLVEVGRPTLGKAEEKRAAIIAQQAARELAEPRVAKEPAARKRRTNWAATAPIGRPGRGRPPKAPEEQ
jgi:hypothetical protein